MRDYQLRPMDCFLDAKNSACIWLQCSPSEEWPYFSRIWNSAPIRVCCDDPANGMASRVRACALEPPSIVCECSGSLQEANANYYSEHNSRLVHCHDQCKPSLEKCFDAIEGALRKHTVKRVVVLGGLSSRLDRAIGTIHSLMKAEHVFRMPIYILDGDRMAFTLYQGDYHLRLDREMLTKYCGLAPLAQRRTNVTTEGFRWNLEGSELSMGGLVSSSNEIARDELRVSTTAPLLMTMQLASHGREGRRMRSRM